MISKQEDASDQLQDLERTIVDTSSSISAATGKLLAALRAFDAAEGWAAAGSPSCAAWLSWRVGVGVVAAREQIRVARALGDLPAIDAALHDGWLSYSKVRAMTRVATPDNEAELLDLAELSTASQLERICRGYRSCRREITGEELAAAKQRRISWRWEDGGLRISGWLPAEEGELVRKALTAALDSLRREATGEASEDDSAEAGAGVAEGDPVEVGGGVAEGDPVEAQGRASEDDSAEAQADAPAPLPDLADALVAMAETSLANGLSAVPGGERTQVVLHLGPGQCCIDDGPPLDLHAALRLSCDAQLLPLWTDEAGRILDVGRARRSIPPAIRRALTLRDQGCRFPGCTNTRFVDAHHVLHWAHGGETKLSNLTLLCRRHHGLVHEGGYSVRAQEGGFEFTDPGGRPIPQVPLMPGAEGPLPLSARRPVAGHHGPWDCGWAIEGLLIDDGLVPGAA